jgi:hypothetical protein
VAGQFNEIATELLRSGANPLDKNKVNSVNCFFCKCRCFQLLLYVLLALQDDLTAFDLAKDGRWSNPELFRLLQRHSKNNPPAAGGSGGGGAKGSVKTASMVPPGEAADAMARRMADVMARRMADVSVGKYTAGGLDVDAATVGITGDTVLEEAFGVGNAFVAALEDGREDSRPFPPGYRPPSSAEEESEADALADANIKVGENGMRSDSSMDSGLSIEEEELEEEEEDNNEDYDAEEADHLFTDETNDQTGKKPKTVRFPSNKQARPKKLINNARPMTRGRKNKRTMGSRNKMRKERTLKLYAQTIESLLQEQEEIRNYSDDEWDMFVSQYQALLALGVASGDVEAQMSPYKGELSVDGLKLLQAVFPRRYKQAVRLQRQQQGAAREQRGEYVLPGEGGHGYSSGCGGCNLGAVDEDTNIDNNYVDDNGWRATVRDTAEGCSTARGELKDRTFTPVTGSKKYRGPGVGGRGRGGHPSHDHHPSDRPQGIIKSLSGISVTTDFMSVYFDALFSYVFATAGCF